MLESIIQVGALVSKEKVWSILVYDLPQFVGRVICIVLVLAAIVREPQP